MKQQDYCANFTPGGIQSRVAGMIFGHALGDAIGAQSKYCAKSTPTWPAPEIKGVPLCDWTDDTDMLMLVMTSQYEHESQIVPTDIAMKFAAYMKHGIAYCGDTAPTTPNGAFRALVNMPQWVNNPTECAEKQTLNAGGKLVTNFALGRAALGALTNNPPGAARDLTSITNPDLKCVAAGTFLACLLSGIIFKSASIDDILGVAHYHATQCLPQDQHAEFQTWYEIGLAGKLSQLELGTLGKASYVFRTFALVCYTCHMLQLAQSKNMLPNIKQTLLRVAQECGDSDTNCAIVGMIIGAYLGYNAFNTECDPMPNRNILSGICARWISRIFHPTTQAQNALASESAHPVVEVQVESQSQSVQCIPEPAPVQQPDTSVDSVVGNADSPSDVTPQLDAQEL